MTLRVYNTLTKKKEDFVPQQPGLVKIYVCGVTPYNHPHIGNARPFVTWDVIRRYLEHTGYDVMHVQNFTDVDDKIINAANNEGITWDGIAGRYMQSYFEVMDKLNIKRAHLYPAVSDHMGEIVEMVKTLQDKGFAYEIDGDVYYSIEKFVDYGKLSGRSVEDMKAGARVDVDEKKNHPMDFALWKKAKQGEPSWPSPWGEGRPGWHIECSAMSIKYLGESFDFHGGGSDLIFPHHENEIAQSEACTGCVPFVKYWLHNGFITVNQEKMSKSLGNFFMVIDILKHYEPEVLRFFLISTHYRSPLDFSDERLIEAGKGLEKLKTAAANLAELKNKIGKGTSSAATSARNGAHRIMTEFYAAMDDDFNTSLAVSTMYSLAKEINIYYNAVVQGEIQFDAKTLEILCDVFGKMTSILGVLEQENKNTAVDNLLTDKLMAILIDMRKEARQNKDWAVADRIRDSLNAIGITIEDSREGVRWKEI